jgi:hypothetical protein
MEANAFRRIHANVHVVVRQGFDQRGDGRRGSLAQRAQRPGCVSRHHRVAILQGTAQFGLDRFGVGGQIDEQINLPQGGW